VSTHSLPIYFSFTIRWLHKISYYAPSTFKFNWRNFPNMTTNSIAYWNSEIWWCFLKKISFFSI
jgi:hypothetical protein